MTVINKHLTKTPLKSCLCYHGTEGRGRGCVGERECVCVCVCKRELVKNKLTTITT